MRLFQQLFCAPVDTEREKLYNQQISDSGFLRREAQTQIKLRHDWALINPVALNRNPQLNRDYALAVIADIQPTRLTVVLTPGETTHIEIDYTLRDVITRHGWDQSDDPVIAGAYQDRLRAMLNQTVTRLAADAKWVTPTPTQD